MASGKYNLAWNHFESCTSNTFKDLMSDTNFTDVTLACEDGEQIDTHRVILASCSSFFKRLLMKNPNKNQVVYMKGIHYTDLQAIINFIYLGQAEIRQEYFQRFIDVAKDLENKGITEEVKSDEKQTSNGHLVHNDLSTSISSKNDDGKYLEDILHPLIKMENVEIDDLMKHDNSEEERFPCNQCKQVFSTTGSVRRHMTSVHNGVGYACDQCDFSASQSGNLLRHKKNTHYISTEFEEKLPKFDNLNSSDHIQVESENSTSYESEIRSKPLVEKEKVPCKQCGKEFSSSASVWKHKNSAHDLNFKNLEFNIFSK